MVAIVAIFIVALYFNNQATIEKIKNRNKTGDVATDMATSAEAGKGAATVGGAGGGGDGDGGDAADGDANDGDAAGAAGPVNSAGSAGAAKAPGNSGVGGGSFIGGAAADSDDSSGGGAADSGTRDDSTASDSGDLGGDAATTTANSGPQAGKPGETTKDERDRALNFKLYETGGGYRQFSEFRGSVVFLSFWNPRSQESVDFVKSITGDLLSDAKAASGEYGVYFITVRVQTDPDGNPAPDSDATPGGSADPIGESAIDDAQAESAIDDAQADGGNTANPGKLLHYVDSDSKLAKLFLIKDYPTTFVFYPSGELCDYKKGAADSEFIMRMTAQAAKSASR